MGMDNGQRAFQKNLSWLQPLGRIWAFPNTALGILLALLGWRNRWRLHNGTVEILQFSGPVLMICHRLGISAFTLGDCVLYIAEPCENLREHEGRHSRQYWILGPFFLPVYFVLLGIYGYWNHPLEKDARAWELSRCGCLYPGQIAREYKKK